MYFFTIPVLPDNESASALQSENLGRDRGSWATSTWNGDLVLFFDNLLVGDLLGPSHIFILIIHWDFVSEFFYFAFFGAFLLGLLYLNF